MVIGGLLIWLLAAGQLARTDDQTWPAALLAAALPFTPLLVLWPTRTTSLWVTDRDSRLFIFSLAMSLTLGLFAYRVWPRQLPQATRNWSGLAITTGATAYVAIFGLKSLIMYGGFHTGGSSPAGFDQALWNGAHWFGSGEPLTRFMSSSLCCDSILSDHAFLIFLPLLPIYAAGLGGPEFLLISQSVSTALAAVALYLLARDRLGAMPAALVGMAYLAFFVNQRTSAGDFRTDAFVGPLLLFAWYAHTQRRTKLYFGLVTLALACKEEVALVVVALGLSIILFERSRLGVTTVVLAVLWFIMDAVVILPYFGGTVTRFYPYYRELGDGPFEVAFTLASQPGQVASYLADPSRIRYLLLLLVPLGFMPVLGPAGVLVALPRLALNLLSGWDGHFSLIYWYEHSITPFLFVAVIHGLDRLGRWGKERRNAILGAGAVYVLSGCLLSAQFWGPHPLAEIRQLEITEHHRLAQKAFDLIPADASVAAQSNLCAHLAHRRDLSVLPDINDADYVLFDVFNANRGPQSEEAFRESLHTVFDDPDYGLIFYQNGYLLFERGADPGQRHRTLAFVNDPHIQNPMHLVLDDTVAFLGFDLSEQHAAPGEPLYLTTYWRSRKPVSRPYLLFTAYPGRRSFKDAVHGLYPVAEWQPGQIIRDEQVVRLPALPDGEAYEMVVGLWYDEGDPSLDHPDQLLGNDLIRIATIEVKAGQYVLRPETETMGENRP